jgi:hypothetical protein
MKHTGSLKNNGILEEEIQKVVAIYTWMKR